MWLKPSEAEGKVTLSVRERREKKLELYEKQGWRCAQCGCRLHLELGRWNTAELDHIRPQPMGCAKDDRESNLQVLCHRCNAEKGSQRK